MSNVVRGDELGIAAASAIHSPGRGSRARNARKARHGRLPALPRFRGAVVAATGKRAANGPIEAQGTAPAPTGAAVVNAACAFEREAVNAGSPGRRQSTQRREETRRLNLPEADWWGLVRLPRRVHPCVGKSTDPGWSI
jgi:hypothetical protein